MSKHNIIEQIAPGVYNLTGWSKASVRTDEGTIVAPGNIVFKFPHKAEDGTELHHTGVDPLALLEVIADYFGPEFLLEQSTAVVSGLAKPAEPEPKKKTRSKKAAEPEPAAEEPAASPESEPLNTEN